MFTPMAFTVGYAILGAMAVALLLMPGLAYIIYYKPQTIKKVVWLEKLTAWYHNMVSKLMDRPRKVFVPLGLIIACTIVLCITVGKDFLPTLDEGSLWLQVQLPSGITLGKAKEMADTLRQHIMRFDEVTYAMTQVGRDDEGVDPFSPSHVECSIGLKPYNEWKHGKRKNELVDEMASDIKKLPGYEASFSQPIIDMVMDQIAGSHSDLAIKVYGDDQIEARRIAENIATVVKKLKGAEDVSIEQEPPLPQLQIHATVNGRLPFTKKLSV